MVLIRLFLCSAALIVLAGCQTVSIKASKNLGGYQWTLIQLDGQAIQSSEVGETPHLIFLESEQRVAGSTGCNRLMGGYSLDASGNLVLGPLATTMMACPNMATEDAFLEALRSFKSSEFRDGVLYLLDGSGETLAVFESSPLPDS